ncbi:DUF817 domain-containing protein [Pectobacterium peruviense]|uniref:DUF817 domain-containing protein n=1 Tax=Pectobacterium peruviense TaxID=2066479 RepID=A0ABX4S2U4_9GAMM|nr:DUF817 domain-containing protein [Pectobacterium peruviense]KML67685.1 membrane protein [Pectobacterium peruviense]PKX83028.1 hypothetical protein A0G02_12435 [Pectobacterium peruviense]PKX84183.1 hypothetical protein A0G03_04780 [Pectobacterium peruviense]
MTVIQRVDQHFQQQLEKGITPSSPKGLARFFIEFLYFGVKEARACLFVGLFFLAVFSVPKAGWFSIPRYDLLLIFAILIQGWMVASKLETWDELKAVTLFHLVGFALEVFKTSSGIRSWSYPDFAYTKVFGVPLFAGFMYASVGSYIIQSWRLFDLKIRHHPPYWLATLVALLIYANFFTHHYIGDYRWYIAALAVGLYARTTVIFTPYDRERRMPLSLAFILIGFFIWLAENISTFFSIWSYPEQLGAWSMVHVGKWSSWALLVIMTFTIVIYLKDIKKSIHVPE